MTSSRVLAVVVTGALAAAGILSFPAAAAADTLTVTTEADSGPGSLRQAVFESQPGDTITFASEVQEITLQTPVTIESSVTISGNPGARIQLTRGTPVMDLLVISPEETGVDVTIENVFASGTVDDYGHVVLVEDDSFALHRLVVDNVYVENQQADEGSAIAVFGADIVTILDSTFNGNDAVGSGGAVVVDAVGELEVGNSYFAGNQSGTFGGALAIVAGSDDFTVHDSGFFGNSAWRGGAVAVDGIYGSTASIVDSGFFANSSDGDVLTGAGIGGSIYVGSVENGELGIARSLFASNGAANIGGAIAIGSVFGDAGVVIDASAFGGNVADASIGTSIGVTDVIGRLAITNSSFEAFDDDDPGAVISIGGVIGDGSQLNVLVDHVTVRGRVAVAFGGSGSTNASVRVANSIIDGTDDATATIYTQSAGYDPAIDYNLFTGPDPEAPGQGSHNIFDAGDPQLGEFTYEGGPVPVWFPEAGSPVIDAGDPAYTGTDFDGRGGEFARVAYGRTDIGAAEYDEPFFADVPTSAALFDDIQWMYLRGISTGTPQASGKPLYNPTAAVSRQAFALFLQRFDTEPNNIFSAPVEPYEPPTEATFADAPSTSPFYAPIEWLAGSGITTGTPQSSGKPLFKPLDAVSRQAVALFLARYDEVDLDAIPAGPSFADVPTGGQFSAAIEWMAARGLTTGTPQESGLPLFRPGNAVSRQALAAFLHRLSVSNDAPGGSATAGSWAAERPVEE